eukprot:2615504-Alexandrium_andersonii.AAC.1
MRQPTARSPSSPAAPPARPARNRSSGPAHLRRSPASCSPGTAPRARRPVATTIRSPPEPTG